MTGWVFRSGKNAGQREKLYAIVRSAPDSTMNTIQMKEACRKSGDMKIVNIAFPTIRRIMQELRDYNPCLAEALDVNTGMAITQTWRCLPMREDIVKV